MSERRVHSRVSAPQPTEPGDLPPAPFTLDGVTLADCTLRQTVRVSIGRYLRLSISNATYLHLTPAGYQALAGALPAGLFQRQAPPPDRRPD